MPAYDDVLPIQLATAYLLEHCGVQITQQRLRTLRLQGSGPKFVVNKRHGYGFRRVHLDEWAAVFRENNPDQLWSRPLKTAQEAEDIKKGVLDGGF